VKLNVERRREVRRRPALRVEADIVRSGVTEEKNGGREEAKRQERMWRSHSAGLQR